MLNQKQTDRMVSKLERFAEMLEPHIFKKVGSWENAEFCHVDRRYHEVPDLPFAPAEPGMKWNGPTTYCWFRGSFTVPEELAGKALYIMPNAGCYEGLLFVDGVAYGLFSTKISYSGHPNHYCDLIAPSAEAGRTIGLAIEYYAGHPDYGTSPEDHIYDRACDYYYYGADICVKDHAVQDFYFDLMTVLSLRKSLPAESFRRGEIDHTLFEVFRRLALAVEDLPFETVRASLAEAAPYLKETLAKKNGDSAGHAGIVGHSHMDTAWLWHIGETVKKCARTYANQLALMEEYPEYRFVQSSACHGCWV